MFRKSNEKPDRNAPPQPSPQDLVKLHAEHLDSHGINTGQPGSESKLVDLSRSVHQGSAKIGGPVVQSLTEAPEEKTSEEASKDQAA